MAGQRNSPTLVDGNCARCGATAGVEARAEKLCSECFIAYVKTKIVKKMETFRVRNKGASERRRLLLPVSFGLSSLVLLDVLTQHLERQINRTGRSGFDLHVVHLVSGPVEAAHDKLNVIKNRYSMHEYSLISYNSHDSQQGARDEGAPALELLDSLPSATARADMLQIQRSKRIAEEARRRGCESVLWGHTTTALAEKVLAETAKGRGASLPYLVQDGPSPYGVNFMYPLRDLLRKEVDCLIRVIDLPVADIYDATASKRVQVSSKGTTIDNLMNDYFAAVENNYPSIVANVVRTSGKLVAAETAGELRCRICNVPLDTGQFGQVAASSSADNQSKTVEPKSIQNNDQSCYGCSRSFPSISGT